MRSPTVWDAMEQHYASAYVSASCSYNLLGLEADDAWAQSDHEEAAAGRGAAPPAGERRLNAGRSGRATGVGSVQAEPDREPAGRHHRPGPAQAPGPVRGDRRNRARGLLRDGPGRQAAGLVAVLR